MWQLFTADELNPNNKHLAGWNINTSQVLKPIIPFYTTHTHLIITLLADLLSHTSDPYTYFEYPYKRNNFISKPLWNILNNASTIRIHQRASYHEHLNIYALSRDEIFHPTVRSCLLKCGQIYRNLMNKPIVRLSSRWNKIAWE